MSNTSKLVDFDHVKEKLIELVNAARDIRTGQDLAERIADHLIANDVVPVVRCEDCEHYRKNQYDANGDMWCNYWADWLPTEPNDFCSYGERKSKNP
jgi:hypothetical protein